jgi:hypothetical protein
MGADQHHEKEHNFVKEMYDMRKFRRFKVTVLAACMGFGLAHAQDRSPPVNAPVNAKEPSSAQIVSTPGGEAIITQINMGPFATAFWRKLQALVKNPDLLADLPTIVEMFDLKLAEQLDAQDSNLAKAQSRRSFTDGVGGFITNGGYSSGFASAQKSGYSRGIFFQFNQDAICLTSLEVMRILGKTKMVLVQPTHQRLLPNEVYENPIGYGYSLIYNQPEKSSHLLIKILRSECAKEFSITQDFNKQ